MSEFARQTETDIPRRFSDRRARFFGRKLIGSEPVVTMLRANPNTVNITTTDGALYLPYTKINLINTHITPIENSEELASKLKNRHKPQPSFLVELKKIKTPPGNTGIMLKFIPPYIDGLWAEIEGVRTSLVPSFGPRVGTHEAHVPIGSFAHYGAAKAAAQTILSQQTIFTAGEFSVLPLDNMFGRP